MLVEQSSRVTPLTSVSRSVSSPPSSHHHHHHHRLNHQLSPQVSHSSSDSSSPRDDDNDDHEVEVHDNDSSTTTTTTTTTSSSTPLKKNSLKREEGSSTNNNNNNSHLLLNDDKNTDTTTFSHIQRLQFAFEKNSVFVNYFTSTDNSGSKRKANSHHRDRQFEREMLTKLPLALTSPPQSHHDNDIKSEGSRISDGEEMDHCGLLENEQQENHHLVQTPSTSPADLNATNAANIFQCPLCSVSCNSRHQFNEHLVSHSQQHACPKCSFLTNDEEELRSHLQQSHDIDDTEVLADVQVSVPKVNSQGKVKTFKCKQCDYIAVTKMDFWDHSKTHIRQEKMLTCPKCPFVTEYKHHLEYHLRNHFGSKPFQCSKCSYSCVSKSMLNSHLKSHSNVYQYRCSDCSYATKYCHSLKLHLRKYNHNPSMVLNLDGTPNPLPIIDVYGTRRGPKTAFKGRTDPNNHQPSSEFTSLNLSQSNNRNPQNQQQQQLVKAICNNNITSSNNNSSGDDDPSSPASFGVTRDRDYNYDETPPPPQNDRSHRHQHNNNRQRQFAVGGSGSDNDNEDNESDSDQESTNTGNFHHSFQHQQQQQQQLRRHHKMPDTPITPTSLGLLQTTLMARNNKIHNNSEQQQQQQQQQLQVAAAAAMAGKSPLELYAAINQYILVHNQLLNMTPSPSTFPDVHHPVPKKNKKSQQKSQSLTQILNQSLTMTRKGQIQSKIGGASPPLLLNNHHGGRHTPDHMSGGGGGSIPLDLRNPKNSPIPPYETPTTDSTEKRKRKGKAMRCERKTRIHALNLSESLKMEHVDADEEDDGDDSPVVEMNADGVLDFSSNNNNNNNCSNNNNNSNGNNNLNKSWSRHNHRHQTDLAAESHLRMNSPVASLMCKHCEISFPDQVLYSMHMSYHSGDFDPFLCKSCGKKTVDKTSFFLHLTTDSH